MSRIIRPFLLVCLLTLITRAALAQSTPPPAGATQPKPLTRDAVTAAIAADQKIVTPHGIEELLPLKINGITQWLSIRGRDTRNPVLLYLHGGPGNAFLPVAWTVESPWEDDFTVVQWTSVEQVKPTPPTTPLSSLPP